MGDDIPAGEINRATKPGQFFGYPWIQGKTRITEHGFDYLDAPPLRVHQEDVPLPYAANLEAMSLPSVEKIVKAAKAVCYR